MQKTPARHMILASLFIVMLGCNESKEDSEVKTDGTVVRIDAEVDFDMAIQMTDSQPPVTRDGSVVRDLDIIIDEGTIDAQTPNAQDVSTTDAMTAIDMTQGQTRIECDWDIKLHTPAEATFVNITDDIEFAGGVRDSENNPVGNTVIYLIDEQENQLGETVTNEDGEFSLTLSSTAIGPRPLEVEPVVILEGGFCGPGERRKLYRCLESFDEDFSAFPQNWTLHGDAIWNPQGWLEMTGNVQGRRGAAYNDITSISSGVASIEFVIITGGGQFGGADGFALTIIDIADTAELDALLTGASSGGGLGYAVAPPFGRNGYNWFGEALTVEIDTWFNDWSRFDNLEPEPTTENHVALTRNGDPTEHIVWFETPNIEDLMPHVVRVDLLGTSIRVTFDGELVIDEPVIFAFKGGYMFFSGSTGSVTNYHRFDAINILSNCY